MDSGDLPPHSFRTDSLGTFAALQETGANRSLINEAKSRSLYNEHDASITPSQPQKAALGVLMQLEAQVVLAWLTILRSSKPGEFQIELLSSHQIAALIELKDCPHSLVEVWLQDAHSLAGPGAPQVPHENNSRQATFFSTSNDIYYPRTDTITIKSSLSGTSTSFPEYSTGYSTPMSSYAPTSSYPNSLNEVSSDGPRSAPLVSTGHPHGCPTCQKDRSFGTCDGWKRHMREHETLYPCDICARSGRIRSYSRRINLLRHLKTHGFSNSASSTLANTWKKTHEKRFFSCGFCVFLCNSLTEQLGHIDLEHFRNFSSISVWDTNKVIRGLLMQPELFPVVQDLLGQPYAISENLSWHPSVVHELQLRLQESNETPEELARYTVLQIDWDLTNGNRNETIPALTFGHICQDGSTLTSPHHEIEMGNDNYRLWTDLTSPCGLTSTQDLQHHQYSLQSTAPNHDSLNLVTQQLAPFDGQVVRAHSNVEDHHQIGLGTQSHSQSNDEYAQGTSHSLLPTWKSNVDEHLNEHVSDANEISGNDISQYTAFAVPINKNTTLCATGPSYQHPISSNVPTAGALGKEPPPDRCWPGSTVAQVLGLDVQLEKQRSREKLVSHYGAPDDLDFEELQYLMRDHDRSRSTQRQPYE